MFAVAIWDRRQQVGLLARDRMGKKPLYYWEHDGALYFASELKALLAVPGFERRLNLEAEPVEIPYDAAERSLLHAGPAVLMLPGPEGPSFVALVKAGRRTAVVLGQDGRLGQEPLPDLVVVKGDLVRERALRDDHAMLGGREQVDEALHQPHVSRAERPQG